MPRLIALLQSRRMKMPGVAVIVLLGVLAGGCTSAPSAGEESAASTSTPAASTARDLGPDPGQEAYRALDVCALVDFPAVLATAGDGAPDLEVLPSVPGTCTAGGDSGSLYWKVAQPRDLLPTSVTAPSEATEDVDTTGEGEVITDKACSMAHVVSAGYVLIVGGPSPAQAGYCSVIRGVGDALRQSLANGPATSPEAGPPATGDLCAALKDSGLSAALSGDVVAQSADHRDCTVEKDDVVLVSMMRVPAGPAPENVDPATLSHGSVFQTEDGCGVRVFADDGAVEGGYWLTLIDREAHGDSCESTLDLRSDAANLMVQSG